MVVIGFVVNNVSCEVVIKFRDAKHAALNCAINISENHILLWRFANNVLEYLIFNDEHVRIAALHQHVYFACSQKIEQESGRQVGDTIFASHITVHPIKVA